MHVDMDAFFASVEEKANPALRGRPVAVVGSAKRTVVTTASYEARRFGVKTGMTRFEAQQRCPLLVFVAGDNRKYIDVSVRVLGILEDFSPVVEVYSVDEAFVDITGSLSLFGSPEDIARAVKERIRREIGITASVGIAPNKLMAKLASEMDKPDGLVHIKAGDVEGVLHGLPVGKLTGIGPSLAAKLGAMGIERCGELAASPAGLLKERFGIIGERLSMMARGVDDSPVVPLGEEAGVKSVGHSATLARDTADIDTVRRHLIRLSDMVARRARRYGLMGQRVTLTVRRPDFYTFTRQTTLSEPTDDARTIWLSALTMMERAGADPGVRLLGVGISGFSGGSAEMPLFPGPRRRQALLEALDGIRDRFGDSSILWGALGERSNEMEPGVISPSWRPSGARRVEF